MKYRIDERSDSCGQPVYMVQGMVGIFRKQWIDLTVSGLPAFRFGGGGVALATPYMTRVDAERAIIRFAGL